LSEDIFHILPTEIERAHVYMTVSDGSVIYRENAQRP